MSDAVTNAEVEDVLSSIRRLVSEDRRPLGRMKAETVFEDKLVLTPSLRVSNDAPLTDAYKKQDEAPPTEWGDGQASESSVALGGSDESISEPEASREDDPFMDEVEFEGVDLGADEPTDDVSDAQDSDEAASHDALHADDGFAHTPISQIRKAGILNLGASDLVEGSADISGSDRLSAKIAALEAAVGRIPGAWESDEAEEDSFVALEPLAMAWEDDIDLDATGTPLPNEAAPKHQETPRKSDTQATDEAAYADEDAFEEDEQPETAEGAQGFGGDEYFDEAMLRDLVADIVRSELQGALGERITRNVRKLVRREIHRALTAQELE